MTLSELGKQYIDQSRIALRARDELYKKLQGAGFTQEFEIKEKIAILSDMADECRRTGEYLVDYYSGHEGGVR